MGFWKIRVEKNTLLFVFHRKINADGSKLASLESQLTSGNITQGVVKENVSSYYICAKLRIITENDAGK